MVQQNILLLQEQLGKLKQIEPTSGFKNLSLSPYQVDAWVSATKGVLERIFGKDSIKIEEIEKIKKSSYRDQGFTLLYDPNIVVTLGSSIIDSCISELERLGLPNAIDNNSKGINLTLIQNQSNKQTINLEVLLNSFNEELTGKQLIEIQEILNTKAEIEDKRKSIKEKLIEFGSNTLSNIIAGILTNPNLLAK